MDFIKTSIKRPVAIIMAMFIVLLLGITSITKMQMALTPSIDLPIAIIMTNYDGAGPEEIENLVTDVIEGAVANVENVDSIMSQSSEGMSMVGVQFNYGTDLDKALTDIRDKVSMYESMLPSEAGSPTVLKMDMNATPIAFVTVTSENMSVEELKSFAEETIQPRLERQNGVADVNLSGGKETEITIEVDPERLEGLGLDIATLGQIVAAENANRAGGNIDYGDKSLTISTKLKMEDIQDIKEIPIRLASGVVMQLQDIATVTESEKEVTSISRYNGEQCISFMITKTSDGNTVTTVNEIKKEVDKIAKEYQDINIKVVNEQGSKIEESISSVVENIFMGAFLSILILFVFLKNVGLTGVIAVSMPLSIIGTFVLLYFSGTTLNLVSLGGLSIGVGMLVDNSVVVLENIYRYRTSEGFGKIKGTYRGTKEVSSSIIASTLTTIVVFVPFIFTDGLAMEMMTDLALSVVFSLVMSLIVAVTVVPMIAANYVNNVHRNHAPKQLNFINKLLDLFDKGIKVLDTFYLKVLSWAVDHKKRTVILIVAIFFGSLTLVPSIGLELMPSSDEGTFSVTVEAPSGSRLEVIDELSLEVEEMLEQIPEMENISVTLSGSGGESSIFSSSGTSTINCELVDKTERKRSTEEIVEEVRNATKSIAGANITVSATSSMSIGGGAVQVEIYGDDLDTLRSISDEIMRQMESVEGTRQITSSFDDEETQVAIRINKDKVRQYGLSGSNIASQIKNTISGYTATTLKVDGTEYDITIKYPENNTSTLVNLGDITISTGTGAYIPLSSIADIEMEDIPSAISRTDQVRYATVSCDVYGEASGSVGNKIQKIINSMNFPEGYRVSMGGDNEMMVETFTALGTVIVLAIALVYMVMAAQFESFINPFIIMFTIPLAFTGAILLLFLGGESISMMALIGCLVLVGIVVNNGIVLIDYINILRERDGMDIKEAVLQACPTRLRPILMTALTTILGQFPLIFSNGTNSEMLRGMGLVIAGGLATSTVLTLLLVPLLYMYFERITAAFRRKFNMKPKQNKYDVDAECN